MNDMPRVMVVEDEPLVSMMLEDMLADLGAKVVLVVANQRDALAAAREGDFDCALLDMNLQGEPADPVAEALVERGIPFAILSGGEVETKALGAVVFVPKPYRFEDIEKALNALNREVGRQDGRGA